MNRARALGSAFRIASILLPIALAPTTLAAERSEAPDRPATRATTRAASRPAPLKLPAIGDRLEVKWGGFWYPASVKNKSPRGWILIQYDRDKFFEWVEPWRVRKVGSDYELDSAPPNRSMFKPEPPPNDPPTLESPEKIRAAKAQAEEKVAQAPATAPVAGSDGSAAKRQAETVAPVDLPLTKVIDSTRPKALSKDAPAWKITPDVPNPSQKPTDKPIELKGGSREFFETSQLLLPRGPSQTALISYIDAPPGKPPAARCERVNLVTGATNGTMLMPAPSEALDLSPNGQLLLARSYSRETGKRDRIDLWTLTAAPADPPKHKLSFKPHDAEEWPRRDIAWAAFADDAHLLTINPEGRLTCWDIANAQIKSLWSIPLSRYTPYAMLSATRKYLVAADETGVVFLDPVQGTLLARLTDGPKNPADFALSDDGKQLAGLSGGSVAVWDLATGKLARPPVLLPRGSAGGPLAFSSEPTMLLLGGGRHLLDLDRRTIVWEYDLPSRSVEPTASNTWAGRCWQLIPPAQKTAAPILASTILPHDAAKQLAATLTADDLLLIKPGVAVSLEVNIEASDQQRQQVIDSLKAKLKANSITVADGQPIKLVAATLLGESKQRSYEQFSTGDKQQVTVTPHITRLAFETADGKIAWESRTASSAGMMLSIKEGQSAQDAANATSQYNIPFLISAQIPAYVTKPRDQAAFGKSPLPGMPDAVADAPKLKRPLPPRLRRPS